MDWKSVGDTVFGAFCGGATTGLAAYVHLGRLITVIDTKLNGVIKDCDDCRQAVLDHHQTSDLHVTHDLRERVERNERRLDWMVNGKGPTIGK